MSNCDPEPPVPTSRLADPPPYALVGVMENKPNQSSGLFNFQDYQLAVVEFDDQGRCYLRHQMKEAADWLSEHSEIDVIIVVCTMPERTTTIWQAFKKY
jgi:hypothetical protein